MHHPVAVTVLSLFVGLSKSPKFSNPFTPVTSFLVLKICCTVFWLWNSLVRIPFYFFRKALPSQTVSSSLSFAKSITVFAPLRIPVTVQLRGLWFRSCPIDVTVLSLFAGPFNGPLPYSRDKLANYIRSAVNSSCFHIVKLKVASSRGRQSVCCAPRYRTSTLI